MNCVVEQKTHLHKVFLSHSVIHLNKRDCSFIFATHLHQLTSMPEIMELAR